MSPQKIIIIYRYPIYNSSVQLKLFPCTILQYFSAHDRGSQAFNVKLSVAHGSLRSVHVRTMEIPQSGERTFV